VIPASAMRHSDRHLFRLILAITLIAGAWFYHRGAWAQASRLGAIYAFCEPVTGDFGRFTIDRFIRADAPEKNGDWAWHDGHYYSNKAPGSFLPGIAVYLPLFPVLRDRFGYPFPEPVRVFVEILLNFVCSGLWTALGAAWFFRLLRQLKVSQLRSSVLALAFAFATPMIAYSTMLWGHPMAAACTVFALYHLADRRERAAYHCGFWAGCAVLTDYICAVFLPVFPLILYHRRDRRGIIRWMAGGLLPALVFGGYHWWCFGTPFTLATLCNNPVFLDPGAAAGVGVALSPAVWIKLLFSTRFGWLIQIPVMLCGLLLLDRRQRPLLPGIWIASCVWSLAAACGINASFNGWHGGATACARYLIPTVPFWMLLLAAVPLRSAARRLFFGITLGISVVNMAAITMTMPLFFHFYDPDYLLQPPLMQKSWAYHPLRAAGLPPLASWLLLWLLLLPLLYRMAGILRLTVRLRRFQWRHLRPGLWLFAIPVAGCLAWHAAWDRATADMTLLALAADRSDILPPPTHFLPWLAGLLSHDPVIQLTWMGLLTTAVMVWGLTRLARIAGLPWLPLTACAMLPYFFSFTGAGPGMICGIVLLILTVLLSRRTAPLPVLWRRLTAAGVIVFAGCCLYPALPLHRTPPLGDQYRLARETAMLRQHYPVHNRIGFYQEHPAAYDALCELAIHNRDAIRYRLPPSSSGVIVLQPDPTGRPGYSLELTPPTER